MAILSTEKGVSQQRGREASTRKGYPQTSLRSSPMQLEDMLPGISGEFAKGEISPENSISPSPVPKTPVSRKVYESATALSRVAHMHKLPLREFQESDPINPRSNSSTPMPSFRRRSNSLCSLGGSSSGEATRASSKEAGHAELAAGAEATRSLSRHEVRERNQDAVEWFRASHAINYHSRSSEETATILAAARARRTRAGVVSRFPKVEKVDDGEVDNVEAEDAGSKAIEDAAAPRRRSVVDPMALWSAKAVQKEAGEKRAARDLWKVAKEKTVRRAHSVAGDGVHLGDTSFLTRLRKKASTIE